MIYIIPFKTIFNANIIIILFASILINKKLKYYNITIIPFYISFTFICTKFLFINQLLFV